MFTQIEEFVTHVAKVHSITIILVLLLVIFVMWLVWSMSRRRRFVLSQPFSSHIAPPLHGASAAVRGAQRHVELAERNLQDERDELAGATAELAWATADHNRITTRLAALPPLIAAAVVGSPAHAALLSEQATLTAEQPTAATRLATATAGEAAARADLATAQADLVTAQGEFAAAQREEARLQTVHQQPRQPIAATVLSLLILVVLLAILGWLAFNYGEKKPPKKDTANAASEAVQNMITAMKHVKAPGFKVTVRGERAYMTFPWKGIEPTIRSGWKTRCETAVTGHFASETLKKELQGIESVTVCVYQNRGEVAGGNAALSAGIKDATTGTFTAIEDGTFVLDFEDSLDAFEEVSEWAKKETKFMDSLASPDIGSSFPLPEVGGIVPR